MSVFDRLRGGVIISCQALPTEPDDPMRDAHVQARVAAAAVMGGALGVRIDSPGHVQAVRALVDVPIIGLFKSGPGPVTITPTAAAARAVALAGAEIVAADATARPRPDGRPFAETVTAVHDAGSLVLADIATVVEAEAAVDAGADAVATTLFGYTGAAPGADRDGPNLNLVDELVGRVDVPVIAEGRYRTGEDVRAALDRGAHCVVVGNAITSPLWLARHLVSAAGLATP